MRRTNSFSSVGRRGGQHGRGQKEEYRSLTVSWGRQRGEAAAVQTAYREVHGAVTGIDDPRKTEPDVRAPAPIVPALVAVIAREAGRAKGTEADAGKKKKTKNANETEIEIETEMEIETASESESVIGIGTVTVTVTGIEIGIGIESGSASESARKFDREIESVSVDENQKMSEASRKPRRLTKKDRSAQLKFSTSFGGSETRKTSRKRWIPAQASRMVKRDD